MRIRVLSDLHLEFMSPLHQMEFVRRLDKDCDVLVLAGDVSNASGIRAALDRFGRHFDDSAIVYVKGNHELYGSSPKDVERDLEAVLENVNVLENGIVHIGLDGQRFLGCSLWFPYPTRGDKRCLTDFQAIRDFEPWVYDRNAESVEWLKTNVQPGDVVVSHHLPAPESVHKKYAGSPLNDFFVCDVSSIIEQKQPVLWVHGHTHCSADYKIGNTRVVCNPYGYFGHEVNDTFDPTLTVTL